MQKMVCLAVLLLAFAIPVRLAADDGGGSKGDCYPGNVVVIASGDTSAKGEANSTAMGITTDSHGSVTTRGSARVGIAFKANVTGGVSTGGAQLKIKWADTTMTGGITETVFESGCVAEIETDVNNGVGEFEGEFEGSVKDFPGYPGTRKAAVLSIAVLEDPSNAGHLQLVIGIDLGYTCFEDVYSGDDISLNLGLGNLPSDEFKITNSHHGQASLPDQASCSF